MKKNILLILAIIGTISSIVFLYYFIKGDRNLMYFITSVIVMISAISIYILDNERFDINKKKIFLK